PEDMLKALLKTGAVAAVSFAMGVAAARYYDGHRPTAKPEAPAVAVARVDLEHEPLWAYGFEEPATPGETAKPQTPPNRNLRPNEDAGEQTRLRRLESSKAEYSLV